MKTAAPVPCVLCLLTDGHTCATSPRDGYSIPFQLGKETVEALGESGIRCRDYKVRPMLFCLLGQVHSPPSYPSTACLTTMCDGYRLSEAGWDGKSAG